MRLSPNGTRLAYVAHQGDRPPTPMITVLTGAVSIEVASGHDPRWLNDNTLLWRDHDTGEIKRTSAPSWGITGLGVLANELTAANGVWAWSLAKPGQAPSVQVSTGATFGGAFEPSLSDNGTMLAFRVHNTGGLAVSLLPTGAAVGLGPGTRPRWSSDTLVWEWQGRVYGRVTGFQPTVELTIPGRLCSFPCPCWDGERLWVAMVVDDGELVIGEWGSLVAKQPKGYLIGASGGSAFDWDWQVAA